MLVRLCGGSHDGTMVDTQDRIGRIAMSKRPEFVPGSLGGLAAADTGTPEVYIRAQLALPTSPVGGHVSVKETDRLHFAVLEGMSIYDAVTAVFYPPER